MSLHSTNSVIVSVNMNPVRINPDLVCGIDDDDEDMLPALTIEWRMLSHFHSEDGTVDIRAAVPIQVDDPLVLQCFNGSTYRPHYRVLRFAYSAGEQFVVADSTIDSIAKLYRNRPMEMKSLPEKTVLPYGILFEEMQYLDSSTCFVPTNFNQLNVSLHRCFEYMYVYAMIPGKPKSSPYELDDEETKFTWYAGEYTISMEMRDLFDMLAPRLDGNRELVCNVLANLPCDAEVIEIAVIDIGRCKHHQTTRWLRPLNCRHDQIQCLKDDDINGNKWVNCPMIRMPLSAN